MNSYTFTLGWGYIKAYLYKKNYEYVVDIFREPPYPAFGMPIYPFALSSCLLPLLLSARQPPFYLCIAR